MRTSRHSSDRPTPPFPPPISHHHLFPLTAILLLILGLTDAASTQSRDIRIAQLTNQSDTSGTNVGDIPAPRIIAPASATATVIDATTVQMAQQISQDLETAYENCVASRSIANTPRRFARGPGNANTSCASSAECDRLTRLMAEAQAFLNTLTRTQAEQLRNNNPDLRLW
jgi:hypothetical protein